MRILAFSVIVDECAKPYELKDCKLVVDAQNFIYNCYENSKLTYKYGAECDKYANYLKRYLEMFKRANVEPYFIFKGGSKNIQKKVEKDRSNDKKCKDSCCPVFMTDVNIQVLQEMGFNYVFTEFEAKPACIDLAKKLSCAVLSMDIEFALSGVLYVPKITLSYKENILKCKLFSLDNLLKKFNLNEDKLAMFIVLTDLQIFNDGTFIDYFKFRNLLHNNYHYRNMKLLSFLSKTSLQAEMRHIVNKSKVSQDQIFEQLARMKNLVNGSAGNDGDFAAKYILCKDFSNPDMWFQYGLASGFIAKPYVDIYRSNLLLVSENNLKNGRNAIELSLSIVKYAYDLLTNFQNDGFKYLPNHWDPSNEPRTLTGSVQKPHYQANVCVFESGWDNVRSLSLFHHFMIEEITLRFDVLEHVPDDAKLLLIALVYFHTKKSCSTTKIAYSVMMCHAMLKAGEVAANLIKEYSDTGSCDVELLEPLLEFQCCLREINYLNDLCGKPFVSTIYANTYNGTVVYNIAKILQNNDDRNYINRALATAPGTLNFVNDLINHYHNLIV